MTRPLATYLGLVTFSIAGSLASRTLHLDPGIIAPSASVLTLLAGVVAAFAPTFQQSPTAELRRIAAVFALGLTAELVGLATGFPFGSYSYSDLWWPTVAIGKLGFFPILLPVAWLLVAGSAALAIGRVAAGTSWERFAPVVAGAVSAVIDLGMEPVMTETLGYWRWLDPGPLPGHAPIANLVGWFGVSTIAAFILLWRRPSPRRCDASWVLAGHVALTLGIAFAATR